MSYLKGARSATKTSQREPIRGRESEQVENAAGGYAFQLGSLEQLKRWLVLGSEGGTYYASQRESIRTNVKALELALREHGTAAVDVIVDVSVAGRAAKQDPVIFALATASAWPDKDVQRSALWRLSDVCRTATQLFMFLEFLKDMRGPGLGLAPKKAVAAWYERRDDVCPKCGRPGRFEETIDLPDQPPRRTDVLRCSVCTHVVSKRDLSGVNDLAYQMVKYRERGGWTHARAIQLSHPVPPTDMHESLYRWALGRDPLVVPPMVEAYQRALLAEKPADTVRLIERSAFPIPQEAIRKEHSADPDVWRALLDSKSVPMGALVRNLGRLTSYGALRPLDDRTARVAQRLTNSKALKGARVHPIAMLSALLTYRSGRGHRLSWTPVQQISDALDRGFYEAFDAVEPSGKRILLAVDVSGSMAAHKCVGIEGLTARMGAAAMALVTAATEPLHHIVAFSANQIVTDHYGRPNPDYYDPYNPDVWRIEPLDISPRQRLADVMETMGRVPAGGTDCALPMLYAQRRGLSVDCFVVLTDNESWAGAIHPTQALREYRRSTGIDAKLVAVGMTATAYSVADPADPGQLDCVGFDTRAPELISAFARGDF